MPTLKTTNFKTGINPGHRFQFDLKNLTGKQKLELVYCRIWGTNIGDGRRSGVKDMRKQVPYKLAHQYDLAIEKLIMPWTDLYSKDKRKKLKFEERRQRVLMRGVKIGRKKLIGNSTSANIFNQKGGMNKL